MLEDFLTDAFNSDEPDPFKVATAAQVPEELRAGLLATGILAEYFATQVGESVEKFLTDALMGHPHTRGTIEKRLNGLNGGDA